MMYLPCLERFLFKILLTYLQYRPERQAFPLLFLIWRILWKHIKTLVALGAAFVASSAFAASAGAVNTDSSGKRFIQIAEKDGKAAIRVNDDDAKGWTANNKPATFEKIKGMTSRPLVKHLVKGIIENDGNGVTVARMYKMKGGGWNLIPMPDHSGLGRMSFAQVGNSDIYFGEWADVAPKAADGTAGINRSVFYSGTGKTTNMPTSGTATYTVKGINNYVDKDTSMLEGQLKADFAKNSLKGTLTNKGAGDLRSLGINAKIESSSASFAGNALANGSINGTSKGNFFGNRAASLAGIAEFKGSNNKFNTAFGGSK